MVDVTENILWISFLQQMLVTLQCNLKSLRCSRILQAAVCAMSMFLSPPDKYLSSLGPEFIYLYILGAANLRPSVQTVGNPTGQVGDQPSGVP